MTLSQPVKNLFSEWYQTPLGLHCKQQIHQRLIENLKQHPNQTILQLGSFDLLNGMIIQPTCQTIQLLNEYQPNSTFANVFSAFACLPLPDESINIAVLPHALEFDADYKTLLNESWRVVSSNGYLVIVSVNPWSLWALQRFMQPQSSLIPTSFQLHSAQKIRHHLRELGAEIILSNTLNYQWSLSQNNPTWLENFAQLLFPAAGTLYLIIAKKSIIPATLIKLRWSWEDLALKGISQPTIGNIRRG